MIDDKLFYERRSERMHALIVGPKHVGKSTLIGWVTRELGVAVSGFETRKEDALSDPERGVPVYIYEIGKPAARGEENRVAYCADRRPEVNSEAFERFAPVLAAAAETDGLVVMDEIGFMESGSPRFCAAVLKLLDGKKPVLAAVKDRNTPFLEAVRTHPNARCFSITEENRERLKGEVLAFLRPQFGERG